MGVPGAPGHTEALEALGEATGGEIARLGRLMVMPQTGWRAPDASFSPANEPV
jgi:hypothetical protein